MKSIFKILTFLLLLLCVQVLIIACSSNDSDNKEQIETIEPNTGVFIDSPVIGIDYTTESYSGKTDEMGRFTYAEGESVQFSIGDIILPETEAESILHLTAIYNSTTEDIRVINLARLLLTLDEDQNADNGISISPNAFTAALGLNINFSSSSFEADVADFIEDAGGSNVLISTTDAKSHIENTFEEAENFTTEDEDALLYGCGDVCVQRANYNDFVVSFYPRHQQIEVPTNTKIKLNIISNANTGTGEFNVELFPIVPGRERCRMDQGGLICDGDAAHDTEAVFANLINGTNFLTGGSSVNPIVFGSADIDNNKELSITPERALLSNTTYVVHVFANEGFTDFKTWWIFKTAN